MSILLSGGRSVSARRYSQAAMHGTKYQIQWPSSTNLRRESTSGMGRRRALDLYGTKDVLFSHEQMKKVNQSCGSAGAVYTFG
jgi:hypothetical protein